MRLAGTATLLLLSGCTLDTRVLPVVAPNDGAAPDVRPIARDGAPEISDDGGEARTDGGPPSEPDGGPPSEPDGGRGDPDAGRPACDDLYGGTGTYSLCEQRDTECEFYDVLGGTTCIDRCARGGGRCVGSWAEAGDPPDECVRASDLGCDYAHGDAICICSR